MLPTVSNVAIPLAGFDWVMIDGSNLPLSPGTDAAGSGPP